MLIGNGQGNKLEGRGGADVLIGLGGSDELDGGDGIDTLDYRHSISGVVIDLSAGTASGGHANGDTILNFENVTGSEFDDNLSTSASGGILIGRSGNDTLTGSGTLKGGADDDTITASGRTSDIEGNDGDDTIAYSSSVTGNSSGYNQLATISGGEGTDHLTLRYVSFAGNSGGVATGLLIGGNHETLLDAVLTGPISFGYDFITEAHCHSNAYPSYWTRRYSDISIASDIERVDVIGGDGADTILHVNGKIYDDGGGTDTWLANFSDKTEDLTWELDPDATKTAYGVDVTGFENLRIRLGSGNDTVTANGDINGGAGNDLIEGNGTLRGGEGNDNLSCGNGNDALLGGSGNDRVGLFTLLGAGRPKSVSPGRYSLSLMTAVIW